MTSGPLHAVMESMDERELQGLIVKVKARIASQKRQIKRYKGSPAVAAAEQFLKNLEAKLNKPT